MKEESTGDMVCAIVAGGCADDDGIVEEGTWGGRGALFGTVGCDDIDPKMVSKGVVAIVC